MADSPIQRMLRHLPAEFSPSGRIFTTPISQAPHTHQRFWPMPSARAPRRVSPGGSAELSQRFALRQFTNETLRRPAPVPAGPWPRPLRQDDDQCSPWPPSVQTCACNRPTLTLTNARARAAAFATCSSFARVLREITDTYLHTHTDARALAGLAHTS